MAAGKPRRQSKVVSGLVLWDNGAIVQVVVDEKNNIVRDKKGRVHPYASHARVIGDPWAERLFELIEAELSKEPHG